MREPFRRVRDHRVNAGLAGTAAPIRLPEQARVLVIVMRRLGDVFLTTALLRTLQNGLPRVTIDVLVFAGTEGILSGNPDVSTVITLPSSPSARELLTLVRRLWRRYDLAISTQSGDRPTFLAYVAGRRRIGLVPARGGGAWWKRRVLDLPVTADPDNHRVWELLRLADGLGIARQGELVCAASTAAPPMVPTGRYAVLHANPMYRFRRWTDDGWRSLARALGARGLSVVVTGGPDAAERAYLDGLWRSVDPPVHRLDGGLDWPQLAALIGGAAVYVGPDTSMTHFAAGTGCATVALYGPASPHRIGPWPVGGLDPPWSPSGRVQRRGNVWVVQNPLPCLPCERLGCDGHYQSHSRCLDELSMRQVLSAVDQALAYERPGRQRPAGAAGGPPDSDGGPSASVRMN
jgi:heptosyltransferase III